MHLLRRIGQPFQGDVRRRDAPEAKGVERHAPRAQSARAVDGLFKDILPCRSIHEEQHRAALRSCRQAQVAQRQVGGGQAQVRPGGSGQVYLGQGA